jgi:hypothetical protein
MQVMKCPIHYGVMLISCDISLKSRIRLAPNMDRVTWIFTWVVDQNEYSPPLVSSILESKVILISLHKHHILLAHLEY